ncbi:hypothetical protein [Streptomyces daliensis]|uniref:Uncharacterized protein n=1 Tax=Streptomyces daliensis TaxID=299421 RepID=A0A8T4J5I0_9ACTN|nr:hypothetical protein [Streptomyces daliensis]
MGYTCAMRECLIQAPRAVFPVAVTARPVIVSELAAKAADTEASKPGCRALHGHG